MRARKGPDVCGIRAEKVEKVSKAAFKAPRSKAQHKTGDRLTVADLFGAVARVHDKNAEARVQAQFLEFFKLAIPDVLVFHVDNGGAVTPSQAARRKWQGVVAGIPDLVLVIPGGQVRFVEVKTPGGAGLSADRTRIHEWLSANGNPPAICRTLQDVQNALKAWNIPMRAVR